MQIPRRPSCICKIACICADMPKSMVRTTLGLGILLHTYCNDMSTSIGMRTNWANGALVFWQFGHYSSLLFEYYCIRRPFARRKGKLYLYCTGVGSLKTFRKCASSFFWHRITQFSQAYWTVCCAINTCHGICAICHLVFKFTRNSAKSLERTPN